MSALIPTLNKSPENHPEPLPLKSGGCVRVSLHDVSPRVHPAPPQPIPKKISFKSTLFEHGVATQNQHIPHKTQTRT